MSFTEFVANNGEAKSPPGAFQHSQQTLPTFKEPTEAQTAEVAAKAKEIATEIAQKFDGEYQGLTQRMIGDQTVHRTRAYAGIEAQAGIALGSVTLTPRIHARYAHDSGDASGTADLLFVSAPNGPVMQALGPGVGRDVAELGGSLDAAVGGNVHLWLGYDGTFRSGAQSHAAKAGVTVAF